jgi:hypothetical protein
MDFLWIFGCFKCVLSMFCLNFTKDVLSKMTLRSIFVSQNGELCAAFSTLLKIYF